MLRRKKDPIRWLGSSKQPKMMSWFLVKADFVLLFCLKHILTPDLSKALIYFIRVAWERFFIHLLKYTKICDQRHMIQPLYLFSIQPIVY